MKKIILTMALAAGLTASAQVKVGVLPTTLATDANFQVEGSLAAAQFYIHKVNGNVGIGTTAPGARLHISGTDEALRLQSSAPYLSFHNATARIGYLQHNGTDLVLTNDVATGMLGFTTNGSTKMTILANGNVGIGTTAPNTKLHVNGSVANVFTGVAGATPLEATAVFQGSRIAVVAGSLGGTTELYFTPRGMNNGSYNEFGAGIRNIAGSGDARRNNLTFFTSDVSDQNVERMRITQNGNVGIGTVNPTSKLQVVGLPVFVDDAAAGAAVPPLTSGAFWRTAMGVVHVKL